MLFQNKWSSVKKMAVLGSVVTLHGLNAVAQTNAVPLPGHAYVEPNVLVGTMVAMPNTIEVPVTNWLSRSAKTQPSQLPAFRRIERGDLFAPRKTNKVPGTALAEIFRSGNDHMGDSSIRDTVLVIFPTGR